MDRLGRRWTIEIGSCVFIVGGILQTAAQNIAMLLVGRVIAGFGIGFLSTVLPVYTAELSRAHNVSDIYIHAFSDTRDSWFWQRGTVTVAGMSINQFGYMCSGKSGFAGRGYRHS